MKKQNDKTAKKISQARHGINDFLINELKNDGITGISPSHGDIIATLIKDGPLTLTALSEKINRDPSTVTALMTKLTAKGYVAMKQNPADKRSWIASLTENTSEFTTAFMDISSKLTDTIWKDIDDTNKAQFLQTLELINQNIMGYQKKTKKSMEERK